MSATIHIALGSNRRHGRFGAPAGVVRAAIAALAAAGLVVTARSRIRHTAPLGPSSRVFANAVIAVATDLPLPALLACLQAIETDFGRRRGRRWGARVLDLDIIAAGTGVAPARLQWARAQTRLVVPHRGLAVRRFILDPLVEIAPEWRHPVLRLSARQLRARAGRPRPAALDVR